MIRSVLADVGLACYSGAAIAKDSSAIKAQAAGLVQQAARPVELTDAEMDSVTAGSGHNLLVGFGNDTACLMADRCHTAGVLNNNASPSGVTVFPGRGKLNQP
jgi:hypothetical protein